MSTSHGYVDCPQCGFGRAICIHDNGNHSEDIMCTACGYEEKWALTYSNGNCYWENPIQMGCGVMNCGLPGAVHFLHTKEELFEAERWLRQQLNSGAIAKQSAYLTRWNDETKSVEALFGDLATVRF
jgi:hypothetical protein